MMSSISEPEIEIDPCLAFSPEHRQERVSEVEHRLLLLADQLRARITTAAAALDLTPQQAIVVRHLGQPRTMGELATLLGCDPSNVTGLVRRLEQRGLVHLKRDTRDKRVKCLSLTGPGIACRATLQSRLFDDSPATAGLLPSERHTLLLILRKLTPDLGDAADACVADTTPRENDVPGTASTETRPARSETA